jgi:hypothetical protein
VVFERIHEGRALVRFVQERLPHYAPLLSSDMRRFQKELIKATAGAAIAAGAGLIFVCFLSVAVIVSSAPGAHRTAVAWITCGMWGLIALVGLTTARRAVAGPPPFHLVGTALAQDYSRFVDSLPKGGPDLNR